jgi:hypothetical protein
LPRLRTLVPVPAGVPESTEQFRSDIIRFVLLLPRFLVQRFGPFCPTPTVARLKPHLADTASACHIARWGSFPRGSGPQSPLLGGSGTSVASPPWLGPCTPFLNVQPSNGGLQPIRATVGRLFPDLAGVTGGFERSGGLDRRNLCLRALRLAQSPQVPNHSRSGCNRLSSCLLPRLLQGSL